MGLRHPGLEPGPVVTSRMVATAWAKDRPQKRPTTLAREDGWRRELADAGYDPELIRRSRVAASRWRPSASADDLHVLTLASRALDRCAAQASTWTRHTVAEHVTRIITEYGVRANARRAARPRRDGDRPGRRGLPLGAAARGRATRARCPPDQPPGAWPQRLRLRDLLTARAATTDDGPRPRCHGAWPPSAGWTTDRLRAAGAVASTDPLVVVEGAAGAGKTTMLAVAIDAAAAEGRATRVVTPTKKAADVAARELGVPAESVAKLLHAHGWRWNSDGVWTRLAVGDATPKPAAPTAGLPRGLDCATGSGSWWTRPGCSTRTARSRCSPWRTRPGPRWRWSGTGHSCRPWGAAGCSTWPQRSSPAAAEPSSTWTRSTGSPTRCTPTSPSGSAPATTRRSCSTNCTRSATSGCTPAPMTATRTSRPRPRLRSRPPGRSPRPWRPTTRPASLNDRIRGQRVARGEVDDTVTVTGSDGLPIGVGDVITTRKNDSTLGVANRQTWTVQQRRR